MTTTDQRAAELLAGLEGVTDGPWDARGALVTVVGSVDTFDGPVHGSIFYAQEPEQEDGEGRVWTCSGRTADHNAAHIARCSPDNLRPVLEAYQAMAKELAEVKAEHAIEAAAASSFHTRMVRAEAEVVALQDTVDQLSALKSRPVDDAMVERAYAAFDATTFRSDITPLEAMRLALEAAIGASR